MNIDLSGLPIELGLAVFAVVAIFYLAQGIFVEFTRRNSYIKDLEIIRSLRKLDNEKAVPIADVYEEKFLDKVDRFNHGRSGLPFILALIIRGTPVFWVIIAVWLIMQVVSLSQNNFHPEEMLLSFMQCVIAGLICEGLFSVLRPWIKPISERYGGVTEKLKDEQKK